MIFKTFQSSLSPYNGVDKENHIAVIALHKCRIERACIFELLKLLNVFKWRTDSDTNLTVVCRHRWSRKSPVKIDESS